MSFTNNVRASVSKRSRNDDISKIMANADAIPSASTNTIGIFTSSGQSISDSTDTKISFAAGTAAFWSGGSPTRITVPTSYTLIRISAQIQWSAKSTNNYSIKLLKNNATFNGGAGLHIDQMGSVSVISGYLVCAATDYFEIQVRQASGGTITVDSQVSCDAWIINTSSTNVGPFMQNQRAMKGVAPNAGLFNKLAHNSEVANSFYAPVYCSLRLAADDAKTLSGSAPNGFGATTTFDTVISDPYSLFSGGVVNVPTGYRYFRTVIGLRFTGATATHLIISNQDLELGNIDCAFSVGTGTNTGNLVEANIVSRWLPVGSFGSANSVVFRGPTAETFTVKSDVGTWFCIEFL